MEEPEHVDVICSDLGGYMEARGNPANHRRSTVRLYWGGLGLGPVHSPNTSCTTRCSYFAWYFFAWSSLRGAPTSRSRRIFATVSPIVHLQIARPPALEWRALARVQSAPIFDYTKVCLLLHAVPSNFCLTLRGDWLQWVLGCTPCLCAECACVKTTSVVCVTPKKWGDPRGWPHRLHERQGERERKWPSQIQVVDSRRPG